MSGPRRFLCLFSSERLWRESFFARHGGRWASDTEHGLCEFVPLVIDADVSSAATPGLFAAATFLLRPADLEERLAALLRRGAGAFVRASLPFEVVASDSPVDLLGRLAALAPELIPHCRQDEETRSDSPSWWRGRARLHLSGLTAVSAEPAPRDELDPAALREFMSRRWR